MSKKYAIIGDLAAEQRGEDIVPGASGAIALALRDLGGEITLRSRIGDDELGGEIRDQIKAARIHPKGIDVVAGARTTTFTRERDGSISTEEPGVLMTMEGKIDTFDLFAHDALVVDLLDQHLRRFIIDLPAHQDGMVRMLLTLRHLDLQDMYADELDDVMRCDTIVGTEAQFTKLTGEDNAAAALGLIFERMPMAHLRAAIAITPDGIDLVSRDSRLLRPVQDAVPDLLLPQVVAGIAWGMANHAEWEDAATVAIDPEAAG